MKNKKLISTFLTLVFFFLVTSSKYTNADITDFSVVIDSDKIEFSEQINSKNGVILLPAKEIFDNFDSTITYYNDYKTLLCYYNNNFAKFDIDKNSCFINGRAKSYTQGPTLINSKSYFPIKFYCDFFSLEYKLNGSIIEFKSRDDNSYIYIDTKLNTEKRLANHKMRIALPVGWKKLDDNSIGIKNPYEIYSFKVLSKDFEEQFTHEQYFSKILAEYNYSPNTYIANIAKSKLISEDNLFYTMYYSIEKKEEKEKKKENKLNRQKKNTNSNSALANNNSEFSKNLNSNIENSKTGDDREQKTKSKIEANKHAIYVFGTREKEYTIKFSHSKKKLNSSVLNNFENSLQTIKLPPYYTSSAYEHYIEYPNFLYHGFELNSKAFSSMEIYNSFIFSGKMINQNNLKLYAKVSKGAKNNKQIIKHNEKGEFNSIIYAPFGPGKHNISIYFFDDSNQKQDIMKFNIINFSPNESAYTIPSNYIILDDNRIKKEMKVINSKIPSAEFLNDYRLSQLIFSHLSSQIKLNPASDDLENTDTKTSEELSLSEKMSEIESNILFCALMRAYEIPSKILIGSNKSGKYYFSEALINGKWYTYDINSEIKHKIMLQTIDINKDDNPLDKHINPQFVFNRFYYIDSTHYESIFDFVETLEY